MALKSMELKKKEIGKHKKTAYMLTLVETVVLIGLVGQAVENPFVVFLNPLWSLWKSLSVRNLMLIVSGQIYLGAKVALRNKKVSTMPLFLLLSTSQVIFTYYFLGPSRFLYSVKGLNICIPVYICLAYNLIFSLSSALFLTYANGTLWVSPIYTRIRGLFAYLGRSIGVISRNTFYIYMVSSIMTMLFVGAYLLAFRIVFSWLFYILPFQLVYETPWRIFKHFLLMSMSAVVYFFLINVIDGLLIYNSSLINMDMDEYSYDDEENLETSRLRFFQMSELSMKYPQIFRKIVKSHQTITSIEAYIRREKLEILKILSQIRKEKEMLDSKIWLSIPQVTPHSDKPKVLVTQKKLQFVKKIRSYNFIEIYTAKIVYFWRSRMLTSRYRNSKVFFLLIKNFVGFLRKYEEDYLLLKDLDHAFSMMMKSLYNEVVDVEEKTKIRLGSAVFSE